ncbi:reverse transcriptase [Gossypium australe]|uniref:Reverse transcriptase n=1 Tax=Gossypium australe TaxID=47621 RepID=A0A5B6WEX3_9ROSI|nr:reverse transcriptase [Gossypium australe]
MSQFRPISLCNVVYKIIAKVLVIRMSAILGYCINEAQGAFIPKRLILDNVIIAYEVLHSLKIKKCGQKGNFALKLDMNKGYDLVEWDFLAGMMKHLGFHDDWIVLTMRCVCSVTYSVSLNRCNSEWFSPSRGLRQGDSLSPFLFLICAEGFSTLISEAKQKGLMQGAPIGRARKRVEGWSLRYLSIGGKKVFIKSVLQAIPLYVMQCFLMLKSLCRKLEGIMNKFWWTNNKTSKGVHWSGWEPLCKPKDAGGMGFKNLFLFNKALLAKQVWRILTQPKFLLAKVLKARYHPYSHILSANIGSYPSFTWRSICSAQDLIVNGMLWRVGNGTCINIWDDPWLPGRENNRLSVEKIMPNWTTVNQLINYETNTWNKELIHNIFYADTATRISSIPI